MITIKDNELLDEFTTALYNLNYEEQNDFLEKLKEKIINHKNNDKSKDSTKTKTTKKSLAKKIEKICKSDNFKSTSLEVDKPKSTPRVCPYCGSKLVIKNGLNHKGEQRFICKDEMCGKSFINRTGHLNYNNQLTEDLWKVFLKGFIRGLTNKNLAKDTGLNETTIHYLKHKVMNMVMQMTRGYNLTGVVQADEYYARASFKGQRSIYRFKFNNEDQFNIVRKNPDYKKYNFELYDRTHSKERLRGLSKTQICYPTALSEDRLFCGKPTGRGIASFKKLESACKQS